MTMMTNPGCTRCSLAVFAKTVCISGKGPLDAEVLFIGDAPDENSDIQGVPIGGRAGKFLEQGLQQAGLNPRITNLVRCKTPGNMEPTKEQIEACGIYLDAELAAMPNLKVIVPMGDVATKHFLGKGQGILKRAGVPVSIEVRGYGVGDAAEQRDGGGLQEPPSRTEGEDHAVLDSPGSLPEPDRQEDGGLYDRHRPEDSPSGTEHRQEEAHQGAEVSDARKQPGPDAQDPGAGPADEQEP